MKPEISVLIKQIGIKIQFLRKINNYSLEDLSNQIDLETRHLRRIENAEVNLSVYFISEIARGLKIPIHEFFQSQYDFDSSINHEIHGQYTIQQNNNKEFYWTLVDHTGAQILISPFYSTKQKCQKKIKESKNCMSPFFFQIKKNRLSQFFFIQKNTDGETLAYGLFLDTEKKIREIITKLILNLKWQ